MITDSNGDLFGTTTSGGANESDGTVFEIAKTATGYATTPTTLVSFDSIDGVLPEGSLIADSKGDLFGTTLGGGIFPLGGTAFEIPMTPTGYASTPTTLVSFGEGDEGQSPHGSLIADSRGDLFGTTITGGANADGTVFEIVKTPTGYAGTPTTLISFNGANGLSPRGTLIADAAGDLFGTTSGLDPNNDPLADGTVFEIKKTAAGYASIPITVASFDRFVNGAAPVAGLFADANGDLFGTTSEGGAADEGTVFEITDSAFVTSASPPPTVTSDILWQNASTGQASIWDMRGSALVGGGPLSPNPGPSWTEIGTGDFNHDGNFDILWQNASGQASIWDMNGDSLIGGGPVSPNPGPTWKAIGTGDFTDDGFSDDILWQNTNSGQASIWEMNANTLVGGGPVSPNPGPAWKAIGTGDFNDDHHSDVLFQNASSGQVSIWEMNGNSLVGGGPVSPNPGPSWQAIGTGDFNHDGLSDILFQNASTGQVSTWEMKGNTLVGGGPVSPNPGPSWHAIGTDGGSDILFQNTNGQASIWDMSGTSLVGGGPIGPNPGPSWQAVGLT